MAAKAMYMYFVFVFSGFVSNPYQYSNISVRRWRELALQSYSICVPTSVKLPLLFHVFPPGHMSRLSHLRNSIPLAGLNEGYTLYGDQLGN